MIRLTHIGKLFLAVTAGLYFASITSQSGLLLLLVGIITGCFLINFLQSRLCIRNLELTPSHSLSIPEGENSTDPWALRNCSRSTAGLVEVEINASVFLRVIRIDPGKTVYPMPSLFGRKRGVYSFENILLGSCMPFGLISTWRRISLQGEWVVHPKVYVATAPPAAGYDLMVGGKHKGNRRTTSGTHFAGVRPMTSGDPLKQIHWKASAKGQGLMVKTYDEELSGRIGFILDVGHSGNADELDDCLRAAGSLMFAGLDEGHHVEWIDPVSQNVKVVPPFDSGHELLEALARIQTIPGCLTESNLHNALEKLSKKSSVVLVLTTLNPAVESFIQVLNDHRRTVSVYLPASKSASVPSKCHVIYYDRDSILA